MMRLENKSGKVVLHYICSNKTLIVSCTNKNAYCIYVCVSIVTWSTLSTAVLEF